MSVAPDYKALVVCYLYGGADSNNLLVPTDDARYSLYQTGRRFYALPKAQLLPLNGVPYGVNPRCNQIQRLYNAGNLAFVANVGTLVEPTTRTSYFQKTSALPTELFSHRDQETQWQSSRPDLATVSANTGWLGRCSDIINALNGEKPHTMNINLNSGANKCQVGQNNYISVGTAGPVALEGFGSAPLGEGSSTDTVKYASLKTILGQTRNNILQRAYGMQFLDCVNQSGFVAKTLENALPLTTQFPDNQLGPQLRMVAKLIASSSFSGFKRQTFFVGMSGWEEGNWDTHNLGPDVLNNGFAELDAAFGAFWASLVEIGATQQVICLTASDFNRTFEPNDTGTDHGWGGHHLAFGAVKSGIYGTFPNLSVGGVSDTERGRWIPSTSLDQYFAPAARWMGLSEAQFNAVFPLIATQGMNTLLTYC